MKAKDFIQANDPAKAARAAIPIAIKALGDDVVTDKQFRKSAGVTDHIVWSEVACEAEFQPLQFTMTDGHHRRMHWASKGSVAAIIEAVPSARIGRKGAK